MRRIEEAQALRAQAACRMCNLTFCCVKCRRNHEEKKHLVNPDCSICISGVIYITTLQSSNQLFDHINESHMPMHCVKCKKNYTTAEELYQHPDTCNWLPVPTPMDVEVENPGVDIATVSVEEIIEDSKNSMKVTEISEQQEIETNGELDFECYYNDVRNKSGKRVRFECQNGKVKRSRRSDV